MVWCVRTRLIAPFIVVQYHQKIISTVPYSFEWYWKQIEKNTAAANVRKINVRLKRYWIIFNRGHKSRISTWFHGDWNGAGAEEKYHHQPFEWIRNVIAFWRASILYVQIMDFDPIGSNNRWLRDGWPIDQQPNWNRLVLTATWPYVGHHTNRISQFDYTHFTLSIIYSLLSGSASKPHCCFSYEKWFWCCVELPSFSFWCMYKTKCQFNRTE